MIASAADHAALLVEQGRVVEPFAGGAWVEVSRQSACGACQARQGCGTRAMARWQASRPLRVAIQAGQPLAVGDVVSLGLPAHAVARASLWTYGLPLGLALAGALLADHLALSEPLVALAFAGGLVAGGGLLRRHLQHHARRYRPRLLAVSRSSG
ncbi:SoxR reducing system RseC family protein [Halomonas sp. M4R1S46]|uniref:SoxR reducing system RseC family protein n=1 Tax=Halomonas sp. M4R1S46 TaxID=2982692 RepID=UPI0021E4707B|nr:SoxR reducing system RseC family protein [Halomonas sp. M4R1S46]UYG08943.1 SoxR reducing system RseC family protein [Halomonas sp. M4R1S46]